MRPLPDQHLHVLTLEVVHHQMREVGDLHDAVVVRLGRRRHRRAHNDVVIGHEGQHFDAVAVEVDQAVAGLGQAEFDFPCLGEEFGQLFGGIWAGTA
jgi:hypothetical protein